jgi:hypothetical protein
VDRSSSVAIPGDSEQKSWDAVMFSKAEMSGGLTEEVALGYRQEGGEGESRMR